MLHNLKYDEPVVSFANAAGVGVDSAALLKEGGMQPGRAGAKSGSCTAISFSTGALSRVLSLAVEPHSAWWT